MSEFKVIKEIWKPVPIPEFKKRYEISNLGRIRSLYMGKHKRKTPRIKKEHRKKQGRNNNLLVAPGGHRKYVVIPRLILMAFVGPCPRGYECAHLNGDPTDDRIDNLKWVTKKENAEHRIGHGTAPIGEKNPSAKLKRDQVNMVKKIFKGGVKISHIARVLDMSEPAISRIVRNKGWAEYE